MRAYLFELESNILNKLRFTKERVFLNKGSILFIALSDHRRNGVSESLSIDKPKERGFKCFD